MTVVVARDFPKRRRAHTPDDSVGHASRSSWSSAKNDFKPYTVKSKYAVWTYFYEYW